MELFTIVAFLSNFLLANEIPVNWDQTKNADGIPAYMDMGSPNYVPGAIRNLELNTTVAPTELQKRLTSPSGLEWSATFSDALVKVSEHVGRSTGCGQPCGLSHSFGEDIFSQVIQDLDARCGEKGCLNDFQVQKGGRNFMVSVNGKYSTGKSNFVSAINEMVKANKVSSTSPRSSSRNTPRGGCHKSCSSDINVSVSQRFSFALYILENGTPSGGGFHSNMDIEIQPVLDAQRDYSNVCRGVGSVIAALAKFANATFGAVASVIAPAVCLAIGQ